MKKLTELEKGIKNCKKGLNIMRGVTYSLLATTTYLTGDTIYWAIEGDYKRAFFETIVTSTAGYMSYTYYQILKSRKTTINHLIETKNLLEQIVTEEKNNH